MVLRRNTFLHILPTLFNLQQDDQLNRTGDVIPFRGSEYNGAYHSISSLYKLFDESPFPHVTWTDVFLQQPNVSSPELGRCLLLPDFMETPQRREVLPLPPSPKVVCELQSHPKFFCYAPVRLRLCSRWYCR